jgi:ferredoxin
MMTLTCCVKNLFGAVVGTGKVAWHLKAGDDRYRFARMLLEIYLLRKPELNIVDGIVAMEGDGPSSGDPRQVGLLLAGVNPIAVDRVISEVLGIPGKRLYVERVAEELDMDGSRREELATVGFPLEEAIVRDFRLPPVSDVQLGIPSFIVRRLRHLITAYPYPLVGRCRQCGICCEACPPRAMELRNGTLRIDYRRCIRCFCCRELCPVAALGIKEGRLLRAIKKYIY